MRPFRLSAIGSVAIFITVLGTSAAAGADELSTKARADLGLDLAKVWCTQCHVVEPQGAGYAQSDVPTFEEVANREGQSLERIQGFLIDPHPPMPDFNLSREEMRNLGTYILSLRNEAGD